MHPFRVRSIIVNTRTKEIIATADVYIDAGSVLLVSSSPTALSPSPIVKTAIVLKQNGGDENAVFTSEAPGSIIRKIKAAMAGQS